MDSFDWTLRSYQYLVRDKWLTLRADICQIPEGKIVEPYYVFEYPTWVNVVAITKLDYDLSAETKFKIVVVTNWA